MPEPRDRSTRKADLIRALTAGAADAWVATASPEGGPHLVPLSVAWIEDRAGGWSDESRICVNLRRVLQRLARRRNPATRSCSLSLSLCEALWDGCRRRPLLA